MAGVVNWKKALQDLSDMRLTLKAGVQNNNPEIEDLFSALSKGNSEMKGVFELAYYYIASMASGSPMQEAIEQRLMQITTSKVQDNLDRGMMMQAITLCAIAAMYEMIMQQNLNKQNTNTLSAMVNKLLGEVRSRNSREDAEEYYWDDYKQDKQMEEFLRSQMSEELKSKWNLAALDVDKAVNDLVSKLPGKETLTSSAIDAFKKSMLKELGDKMPSPKLKKQ